MQSSRKANANRKRQSNNLADGEPQEGSHVLVLSSYTEENRIDIMMAPHGKFRFSRPRLLLAYASSAHAALTSRQFRRQGWEVHLVHSGVEARRIAHLLRPQLVLLDIDLPDESGWLSCAKLQRDFADLRVYIVGDEQRADSAAFSAFVGAAGFIRRDQSQHLLLNENDRRNVSVAV